MEEDIKANEPIPHKVIKEVVNCGTLGARQSLPRWATFEFYAVQYSRTAKFATSIADFNNISVSGKPGFFFTDVG